MSNAEMKIIAPMLQGAPNQAIGRVLIETICEKVEEEDEDSLLSEEKKLQDSVREATMSVNMGSPV